MSVSRIISLTERALLNSTVLDFISPTNSEKLPIYNVGNSVIISLAHAYEKLCTNPVKNSWAHWAAKPLRAIARAGYVSLTTCFISPLGALCYGTMTVYSFARSKYYLGFSDPQSAFLAGQKTKEYAQAFFIDLKSTVTGVLFVGMEAFMVFATLKYLKISLLFAAIFGSITVPLFLLPLGAYTYEMTIPQWLAVGKEESGMRLALALRNELGLVDEQGELLKYSENDHFEFQKISQNTYKFLGRANDELTKLVVRSETELFNQVIEVNSYLKERGKEPIAYSYPFDGKVVAAHLSSQCLRTNFSSAREDASIVQQFMNNLIRFDRRAMQMRELYYTASRCSLKAPIKEVKCYLDEESYKEAFSNSLPFSPQQAALDFKEELKKIQLEAAEEKSSKEIGKMSLYDRFKYFTGNAKRALETDRRPYSYKELLGLSENCSKQAYKKALRDHQLALHPDKNSQSLESRVLFNLLELIKAELDKEFFQTVKT